MISEAEEKGVLVALDREVSSSELGLEVFYRNRGKGG